MSSRPDDPFGAYPQTQAEAYVPLAEPPPIVEPPRRRLPVVPIVLFLLSCASTYYVHGWQYAVPVMGILVCHEFGHYIQARRYRVPASLPYFIPFPYSPLGTMGAVIAMRGHMGNRKALFDIGISGPLAGLLPTVVCCVVGLSLSTVVVVPRNIPRGEVLMLGEPLLFQWLEWLFFGPLPENQTVWLHPLAFAGWVGVFLTALNLFPISQLDGGHVLYAMLREKAHYIAWLLLIAGFAGMALTRRYEWAPILFLLMLFGPSHPPTANDEMPLGAGRFILGWATLAFLIIGFTPTPLTF
jgi:membrane-associated protease RseP (regulator of RpoE activity)